MTTIILTIIGILLAAAAALMVIFYGGDAFNSGAIGAQANQIQNAGTNVVSAVQMFKAERAVAPNSPTELLTPAANGIGAYLDELPALPDGATGALVPVGTSSVRVYQVSGVARNVCDRINTNLRNPAVTPVADVAAATLTSSRKMGCIPTAASGVFFARG